jgi:eukaryotic-like serine/threonine-protein kinase
MPIDPELEEILLRWEEHRDRGEWISVEDLCQSHPERIAEVLPLIRRLADLESRIPRENEPSTEEGSAVESVAGLPSGIPTGGRYQAVRLHARGGLGEVFLAVDEELHREVALKVIQRPYDSARSDRFMREARITANLGHPGIVPIFGLGRASDGRPCLAMRYIEGETLGTAMEDFHEADVFGRDPIERALTFHGLRNREKIT